MKNEAGFTELVRKPGDALLRGPAEDQDVLQTAERLASRRR